MITCKKYLIIQGFTRKEGKILRLLRQYSPGILQND